MVVGERGVCVSAVFVRAGALSPLLDGNGDGHPNVLEEFPREVLLCEGERGGGGADLPLPV